MAGCGPTGGTVPQVLSWSGAAWRLQPRPKPVASPLFVSCGRNSRSRTKAGCPSESQEKPSAPLWECGCTDGCGNTEHGASPGVGEGHPEEAAQDGTRPLPGCQELRNPFLPLPRHRAGLHWIPHHLNREVTFANTC